MSRAAPLPARHQSLVEVRLSDLLPDPDNPRDDVGDVSELAASMQSAGLLQPIVARCRATDGRFVVVAGHRRLAAAQELGWSTVPVILRRDMRPDEVLAAMLIENGQRRDLDPIEEARAFARLKAQMQCSDVELARRIGRSQSQVSSRLALLALSIEEQDQVRDGTMKLVEATAKARIASGRVKPGAIGRPAPGHLNTAHPLASRAKARCIRLQHSRGRGVGVGGIACGECWESVIRADERDHLHTHSASTGQCALCSTPLPGKATA